MWSIACAPRREVTAQKFLLYKQNNLPSLQTVLGSEKFGWFQVENEEMFESVQCSLSIGNAAYQNRFSQEVPDDLYTQSTLERMPRKSTVLP